MLSEERIHFNMFDIVLSYYFFFFYYFFFVGGGGVFLSYLFAQGGRQKCSQIPAFRQAICRQLQYKRKTRINPVRPVTSSADSELADSTTDFKIVSRLALSNMFNIFKPL